MAYCFDTSSLIECWSRSYPPDVFPGLWLKMEDLVELRLVVSPEEVMVELGRQDDGLAKWARDRPSMFLALDEPIQRATRDVLGRFPLLMKATKNRNGADPFVIAAAVVHGFSVVTEEIVSPETKPKIPFVCRALNVRCIGRLEFLREQGWTFD